MKTTKLLPVWLLCAAGLGAMPRNRTERLFEPPSPATTPAAAAPNPEHRFELHASFAQGNKLAGFYDPRYVAPDKSDYLKAPAQTANLEFAVKIPYKTNTINRDALLWGLFDGMDFLRLGLQMTAWVIPEGANVSIPKLGTPVNSSEPVHATIEAMTRPGMGFFFGFGKKDFELDIGLHIAADIQCEGSRTRRVFDGNGNAVLDASGNVVTEQVPGRGCSPATIYALPTLKFSWGARGDLQFFITAGRETFEFHRDYLQTYFRIPLLAFLKLDLGAGIFPNATLFLQPNFDLGPVSLAVRGGLSLNYYQSELRRVALADAFYLAASVSGRF